MYATVSYVKGERISINTKTKVEGMQLMQKVFQAKKVQNATIVQHKFCPLIRKLTRKV